MSQTQSSEDLVAFDLARKVCEAEDLVPIYPLSFNSIFDSNISHTEVSLSTCPVYYIYFDIYRRSGLKLDWKFLIKYDSLHEIHLVHQESNSISK